MEWGRRFVALTLAWLAFETLSGLAIYLLPFSVPSQWTVVVHTGLGLTLLVPALVYQWQHLRVYWSRPRGPVKWMGYLATSALLAAVISGAILTLQAIWGTRISYAWQRAHLLSTFALLAFALPHVVVILIRDRSAAFQQGLVAVRQVLNQTLARTAVGFLLMLAPLGILWSVYSGERLDDRFPPDYSFAYGAGRPFAPSLATTATVGPSTRASWPARSPAAPWAATNRSPRSGA